MGRQKKRIGLVGLHYLSWPAGVRETNLTKLIFVSTVLLKPLKVKLSIFDHILS